MLGPCTFTSMAGKVEGVDDYVNGDQKAGLLSQLFLSLNKVRYHSYIATAGLALADATGSRTMNLAPLV